MKKVIAIVVLGLLLSGNAYAECISGNCKNGYGEYHFDNGEIYIGEWKKGLMWGKGKYTWPWGAYYEGDFVKHKHHGYGKFEGKNVISEGKWRKNKFLGTKVYKNSAVASNNNETSGNFEFTTSIGKHKNTCKELGFTPGTEKFGDCALKLIELEVAQQGNNKAAQQIQIIKQEPAYDGWMGELGLSILRGDFNKKVQQPAYRFTETQTSTCRWQSAGIGQPYMRCTTN